MLPRHHRPAWAEAEVISHSMAEKLRLLEELRERIVKEVYLRQWREVWFFPPYRGVGGWCGTWPAFFVGLNVSTGHFPDRATKRLYRQLRKHGLGSVHLTDLVKERATSEEAKAIFRDDEKRAEDVKSSETVGIGNL